MPPKLDARGPDPLAVTRSFTAVTLLAPLHGFAIGLGGPPRLAVAVGVSGTPVGRFAVERGGNRVCIK
jgi:hypothetical protein